MSVVQPTDDIHDEVEIVEIRVQGHLRNHLGKLFEGLTISRESDGTTTLCGPLPDQTALHSILLRIRNMNLKLISFRTIETPSQND